MLGFFMMSAERNVIFEAADCVSSAAFCVLYQTDGTKEFITQKGCIVCCSFFDAINHKISYLEGLKWN